MKPPEPRRARASNVNLQALEVFCEVARLASFSRGAAVFGLSQSAASQLVAHLESELGFQLIDRSRRPLELTPEGRRYYLGCREILQSHRGLLGEVRRRHQADQGTVRVASIYSVGLHTLSRYMRRFLSRFRGSTVYLEYFHPHRVYAAVLADEADLGVVSYPRAHRQLQVTPWLEEEMVLACPPGHHLAAKGTIGLEELDGEQFVAFDPELQIRREVDRALRARRVNVEVVSAFDNIETIKQALEISEAVSVLPRPSIQREVDRGTLVEVELAGVELVRPVGIIRKRRRKLTPVAEQFLETLMGDPPPGSVGVRLQTGE